MNASKENAEKAIEMLRDQPATVTGHHDIYLGEYKIDLARTFLLDFLNAAYRKLPHEKSFPMPNGQSKKKAAKAAK